MTRNDSDEISSLLFPSTIRSGGSLDPTNSPFLDDSRNRCLLPRLDDDAGLLLGIVASEYDDEKETSSIKSPLVSLNDFILVVVPRSDDALEEEL